MALGKTVMEALKDAEGVKISDTKAPLNELQDLVKELKDKHKIIDKWKAESSALYAEMAKAEVAIAAALKQIDTRKKACAKKMPAPSAAFQDDLGRVLLEGGKYATKLKERIKDQKEITDALNKLGASTKASD